MSDTTTDVTETGATGENTTSQETKPTETVEFWKEKARLQEKRAKENADAAKRLAEIEDAQKSDAEKTAERLAKADAEIASIPARVAEALREHLVTVHSIAAEDAELFLTADEPELLLKQVARLVGQKSKGSNHVPAEGRTTPPSKGSTGDRFAEFADSFFTR